MTDKLDPMKTALAGIKKDYRKMSVDEIKNELLDFALKASGDWKTQVASCVILKNGQALFGVNHLSAGHKLTDKEIKDRTPDYYHKMICSETDVANKAEELMLDLTGATVYSSMFPCPRCAERLSEAKVSHIKAFYCKVKKNGVFIDPLETSQKIFDKAGITYEVGEARDN